MLPDRHVACRMKRALIAGDWVAARCPNLGPLVRDRAIGAKAGQEAKRLDKSCGVVVNYISTWVWLIYAGEKPWPTSKEQKNFVRRMKHEIPWFCAIRCSDVSLRFRAVPRALVPTAEVRRARVCGQSGAVRRAKVFRQTEN